MPDFRCPNCQTDLTATAQFCRRCGFKVSAPLVSPSATEATTRNLPNPPQMTDYRQTNNFGSSPFGVGQPPPGNFQPQVPYVAVPVPVQPPRRNNGPKILLVAFLGFALMAFCMVFVIVNRINHRPGPASISRPATPISGTSYSKSFKLPADGQISLTSMSGPIKVTTYDGDTVEFTATRGDGSNISMDDAIEMKLTDNAFSAKNRGGRNASVGYQIKIPRKMGAINLNTVSGSIKIEGMEGNIKIKSTSGEVSLADIVGSIDLETISGDQSVTFKNPPTGDSKFKSISGDISLKFLTEPDVKVAAHTVTGDIRSDFQLNTNSRPASTNATGVLGKGLFNLVLDTISGDMKIER